MVLQSKRIGRFFMIGVYDYTVIATYLSLLLGLGGLYSAAQNEPLDAMLCLMLAGLLDAFDGRIARTKKDRTEQEKRFGIQIDSLNDLVCFGVLPAAIGWSTGCERLWFLATMSFFALCALIRLAYFNVTEEERQNQMSEHRAYYLGVPVTASAVLAPLFYLLSLHFSLNWSSTRWGCSCSVCCTSHRFASRSRSCAAWRFCPYSGLANLLFCSAY